MSMNESASVKLSVDASEVVSGAKKAAEALDQVATSAEEAGKSVDSGLSKAGSAASSAAKGADKVAKANEKAAAASESAASASSKQASAQTKAASSAKDVSKAVGDAAAKSKTSFSSMVKDSGVLQKTTKAVGVAIAGLGAASLWKGLQRVESIQDATRAATIVLKDGTKAAKLMDNIMTVVTGTPYAFDQFATAGKNLAAFGISAEKIPSILTAIGDSAAASGKGAEAVGQLTDVFGKMAAQGTVQLDDVWSISSAGVPALQILANSFHTTTDDMKKMISSGALPAGKAIDALTQGIEKGSKGAAGSTVALGGTMKGLGDTLSGSIANMQTSVARMGANIITPLTGDITGLMKSLTGTFDDIGKNVGGVTAAFAGLPKPVKSALGGVTLLSAEIVIAGGAALIAAPKVAAFRASLEGLGGSGKAASKGIGLVTTAAKFAGIALLSVQASKMSTDWIASTSGMTKSTSKFTAGIKEGHSVLDQMNSSVPENATGLRNLVNVLGGGTPGINMFTSNLSSTNSALSDMRKLTDTSALGGFYRWQSSLPVFNDGLGNTKSNLAAADSALAQMVQSGNIDGAKKQYTELYNAITDNGKRSQDVKGQFGQYSAALEQASSSTQKTVADFGTLGDSASSAQTQVQSLSDTIAGFGSDAIGAASAQLQFKQAVADAEAAAKKNGKTTSDNTEKGRANRQSLIGLAQAAISSSSALAKVDDSGRKSKKAMSEGRSEFIKTAQSMGMSRSAAKKLADQYGLIPKNVKTDVKQSGADKAKKQAKEVKSAMDTLKGVVTGKIKVDGSPQGKKNAKSVRDALKLVEDVYSGKVKVDGDKDAKAKAGKVLAALEKVPGSYLAKVLASVKGKTQADQLRAAINKVIGKKVNVGANVTGVGAVKTLDHSINTLSNKTVFVTTRKKTLIEKADGGLVRFADGTEDHTAQIAPAGAMRLWAEPETGGEAYIPLAKSKRGRSKRILENVANRFGLGLVALAEGSAYVAAKRDLDKAKRMPKKIATWKTVGRGKKKHRKKTWVNNEKRDQAISDAQSRFDAVEQSRFENTRSSVRGDVSADFTAGTDEWSNSGALSRNDSLWSISRDKNYTKAQRKAAAKLAKDQEKSILQNTAKQNAAAEKRSTASANLDTIGAAQRSFDRDVARGTIKSDFASGNGMSWVDKAFDMANDSTYSKSARDKAAALAKRSETSLLSLTKSQTEAQSAVDKLTTSVTDLTSAQESMKSSLTSTLSSFDLSSLITGSSGSGVTQLGNGLYGYGASSSLSAGSVDDFFAGQNSGLKTFNQLLTQLSSKGYPASLVAYVASMGVENGSTIAKTLLSASESQMQSISANYTSAFGDGGITSNGLAGEIGDRVSKDAYAQPLATANQSMSDANLSLAGINDQISGVGDSLEAFFGGTYASESAANLSALSDANLTLSLVNDQISGLGGTVQAFMDRIFQGVSTEKKSSKKSAKKSTKTAKKSAKKTAKKSKKKKNADGGLYTYANADGGIYSGVAGSLYKFAEPETRWEAFVSGKPGQEARNRGIALEAYSRLGGVMPQPVQVQQVVYVQNPWTGEYHEAQMTRVARSVSSAQSLENAVRI